MEKVKAVLYDYIDTSRQGAFSMKFNFHITTKIIMDEDCVAKNAALLAPLGKKALIVTGAHSAKANGALSDVSRALSANGQSFVLFDNVMSNPTVDCVYEGANFARNEGVDFVVAIGGGSPMDASKAIAMLACEDIPKDRIFEGGYNKRLPLCCIPTTAGTGSETTQYAILINDEKQTKTSLGSPVLFPDLALLDSKYMESLTKYDMTYTVIDAFSHSVEGFLTKRANSVTDTLALEAIKVIASLFPAIDEWRLTAKDRAELLYASTLSGMVIAHTGTTAVHPMGYSLTYFKNFVHGRANGLLLPEFLKFTEKKRPDRVIPILKAAGFASTDEFACALSSLLGERESATENEIRKYSSIVIKAKNIANCVVEPSEEDLKKIYRLSLRL